MFPVSQAFPKDLLTPRLKPVHQEIASLLIVVFSMAPILTLTAGTPARLYAPASLVPQCSAHVPPGASRSPLQGLRGRLSQPVLL